VRSPLPRSVGARLALVVATFGAAVALVWWRGPSWDLVREAFTSVYWRWVVAAIALNLASVLVRSLGWRAVIHQAMPPPRPSYPLVFSAFSVGLFANAVLPGRIGELARVAVLTRRLPGRQGVWATLVGTVFAHRVFDIVAVILLILYVLWAARIPAWAITSLVAIVAVGLGLLTFAIASARLHHRPVRGELGAVGRLVTMARHGLGVMRAPVAAARAVAFQCLGWGFQLFAVYATMRAFNIEEPLAAAGLVLLLMNVATMFPLWPGNVGLLQAAVALPLVPYGIDYAHGFAFGIGLQAVEASVGVGVGLLFLAREGLSFAMLRHMPDAAQAEVPEEEPVRREVGARRRRARVPG
jgi:glycosyltransferase 2 family protein